MLPTIPRPYGRMRIVNDRFLAVLHTHTDTQRPAFARRLASCASGSSFPPSSSLSVAPPLSVTCSTCDPVQLLQRWRGTDAEEKKKGGGGVRVIGQNNPIWWPSYYPAIGVQQRKGCRQKFNYLLDSVCFDNQLIIHPMSDAQSRCHHITDSLCQLRILKRN